MHEYHVFFLQKIEKFSKILALAAPKLGVLQFFPPKNGVSLELSPLGRSPPIAPLLVIQKLSQHSLVVGFGIGGFGNIPFTIISFQTIFQQKRQKIGGQKNFYPLKTRFLDDSRGLSGNFF